MATDAELADLAYPEPVRQPGTALGQLHGDHFTAGQLHALRGELFSGPRALGKLVIGMNVNLDELVEHDGGEA